MKISYFLIISLLILGNLAAENDAGQAKLKVCVTVSDLANLVEVIGGDEVEVTTFAPLKGDPHFVVAKPNFIKQLSEADIYVQVGFELETGWAPVLLKGCRNAKVQPGQAGHIDPSNVIKPQFEFKGKASKAEGHVHPNGNPHYLLDPVNGLVVAHLINSRLKTIRPEKSEYFNERLKKFQEELISKLLGEKLAAKYDNAKLGQLVKLGRLEEFLAATKQETELGGWLGAVKNLKSKKFVADHANYLYFISRFEMEIVAYLEPKPGMEPTTTHLLKLINEVPSLQPQGILTNSYFPAKYSQLVAEKTKLPIIKLAHQVGAIEGCDTYLKMVEYNVKQILENSQSEAAPIKN